MLVPLVVALSLVSPAAQPAKAGAAQAAKTASTKRPAWVALVRTDSDVPAKWRDALQKSAAQDTSRSWVPPPAVTLDEAEAALGCGGWSDQCAGQIASMTGASMALVVEVKIEGAGVSVSAQKVKGGGKGEAPAEKLDLPGRGDDDLEVARTFVAAVLADKKIGLLSVDADLPGATVLVDGEAVGKTPWRGAVVEGEHMIELRAEGKAPVQRPMVVAPGQNAPISVSLNATNPNLTTNPTVGNNTHEVRVGAENGPGAAGAPSNAIVGWSLAGAGGVIALGATAVGGPWAFALLNRPLCGPAGAQEPCLPREVSVYGIDYVGAERSKFLTDAGTVISASVAAVGVGALLIGTGVVLATAEPGEGEAAAPAPAAAPAH